MKSTEDWKRGDADSQYTSHREFAQPRASRMSSAAIRRNQHWSSPRWWRSRTVEPTPARSDHQGSSDLPSRQIRAEVSSEIPARTLLTCMDTIRIALVRIIRCTERYTPRTYQEWGRYREQRYSVTLCSHLYFLDINDIISSWTRHEAGTHG